MCSGTSNSAASSAHARRISGVQVYGACGAGPGTINGWPRQRPMNSRASASDSSKLVASGVGKRSTVCAHNARIPAAAVASAMVSSK
jgi:hypothetical protein